MKPLKNKLLVKHIYTDEKTKSGIILDSIPSGKGEVLEVGKDCKDIKKGDTVLYPAGIGIEYKENMIFKEHEIFALSNDNIQPLQDRILIEEPKEITLQSGIILAEEKSQVTMIAKVIAVSNEINDIKPNHRLIINKRGVMSLHPYHFIRKVDCLAGIPEGIKVTPTLDKTSSVSNGL